MSAYASVNGVDIYYEVHGRGRPLVLLHGALGTIESCFQDLLPALAASFRVIAVELQGHGHTRDVERPFSFRDMAEDVAGLFRLLGIETADVFGYQNDRQIVSGEWVRAATGADNPSDQASYYGYRYFWWLDVDRPGRFYAFGKYGQFIYVAPDADAVIVRLGRSSGVDRNTWLATFRDVTDQLERRP